MSSECWIEAEMEAEKMAEMVAEMVAGKDDFDYNGTFELSVSCEQAPFDPLKTLVV